MNDLPFPFCPVPKDEFARTAAEREAMDGGKMLVNVKQATVMNATNNTYMHKLHVYVDVSQQ